MPSGPRIRGNLSYGLTSDNPLTAGAVTFNSAGLVTLPPIVATHGVITLDPRRVNGEPEIVVVTSHASSATVATITRGQYGTVARAHPQNTEWVHQPIDEDYTEILTSSTRPTDPYAGQMIFETDTDKFVARIAANSAWQDAIPLSAWQNYTPTNANITLGNGVQVARFTRVGRIIHVAYELTFGTTTAFTADVSIGLPVATATAVLWVGSTLYFDGSVRHLGNIRRNGTVLGQLNHAQPGNNVGVVNPSFPFVWATGDSVCASWTYEAAS